MATWRARGEEGNFGHVKGHLWGFRGPLHDGRGSASGGSNFSKPVGRGSGVGFCGLGAGGCECVHENALLSVSQFRKTKTRSSLVNVSVFQCSSTHR